MGVSSYVLIQTEMDKARQVAEAIREIDGVVISEIMTGPYDVIAKAEAESMDQLGRLVVSQIQMVDGITRTLTCPVVNL
ncbi:MAG: Lrp/AsnC ligand binding domain-containing protein [bacterium]|uniref:Lrp/AsnC family transcriptional regulator n=1 Tax=Candidatus Poriferisocius sp. TaxID=3101276 RepID=UPI00228798A6|nr:Lrp/AsnC ligand binding domain-containing protein [bacterium]MCY3637340.1 Lrp/AsnC ligand binding domain-containing protein [bacterium]MCY3861232.1 Lrp/AsnC ligand binding domain-containing protein [bacterium]MCY3890357.1 Lrp/AsnC ligand binding domain-containing protein [bacterium]MCY3960750.1 Lrp/AsnC ligand binding domain-containing protein [bacterium]